MKLAERWKEICGSPEFVRRFDLQHVKQDDDCHYFSCPWCKEQDHYATMTRKRELVLHCYTSGRVGFVVHPDPVTVIEAEEKSFLQSLDRVLKKMPTTLTAQEAFEWITAKGAPRELAEDRCDDSDALKALLEDHREKSRKSHGFSGSIF